MPTKTAELLGLPEILGLQRPEAHRWLVFLAGVAGRRTFKAQVWGIIAPASSLVAVFLVGTQGMYSIWGFFRVGHGMMNGPESDWLFMLARLCGGVNRSGKLPPVLQVYLSLDARLQMPA